jgi:hypothetical protein
VALEALLIKSSADRAEAAAGHGAEVASLRAQIKALGVK